MIDDREREKKPGETALQWRERIARLDFMASLTGGPLLTPEAERHAEYSDDFVMHAETATLARTRRNRRRSPLEEMLDRGVIAPEQFDAATEIMAAIEMIERDVSVRSASLEARVDNIGSAKGLLIERLAMVRLQVAYGEWRNRLPMPKRLVIDMLMLPQPMARTARSYSMGWPKARCRLLNALDEWAGIREKVWANVDADDVQAIHWRLGGGAVF